MGLIGALRSSLASAFALVLPLQCAGCGAHDFALCSACRSDFEQPVQSRDLGGLRVWSAASYEGPVARAVGAFKDSGATACAAALGGALRRALTAAVEELPEDQAPIVLVPIPSSGPATRRRGYVPLEVIARAGRLPLSRSLRHVRAVRDQTALSALERAENLDQSMAADRAVRDRDALLLDDVVTTGSTLREAARAIREAGGRVLGAATVASTPSPSAPRSPPDRPRETSRGQP